MIRFSSFAFWLKIFILSLVLSFSFQGFLFFKKATILAVEKTLDIPQPQLSGFLEESTKLYDREGNFLYEIHGPIRRKLLKIEDTPEKVKLAFIAVEDQDFYQNKGFSLSGITRAITVNVREDRLVQGGSTITQQLARYLTLDQEKTLERKLKEIAISYFLTLRYPKEKILERYFNEVSVGGNLVGLGTAAEVYFQKEVKDLSLEEGAVLAALVNAPTHLNPYHNKGELLKRANIVLSMMYDLGFLNFPEYSKADTNKVAFSSNKEIINLPFFSFYTKEHLEERLGKKVVEKSGFKVITTIDPKLQKLAEATIKRGVEEKTKTWGANDASLVVLDPNDGKILAMVGGLDFWQSQVNLTTAKRQPGSAIKPLVYLTAFEQGYSPETKILDKKTTFPGGYSPTNYGNTVSNTWWSAREALVQSLNIPAVLTLNKIGIPEFVKKLNDLGVKSINPQEDFGLSLALGTAEISPIELANAYGILANGGKKIAPDPILKIYTSSGEIFEDHANLKGTPQIADPLACMMVTSILSDYETKKRFYKKEWFENYTLPDRPAAAKTGTSSGPRDVWTVGFTPDLVVAVWAGNKDGSLISKKSQADGITIAAPIWREFMTTALEGKPTEDFPQYEKKVLDSYHQRIQP